MNSEVFKPRIGKEYINRVWPDETASLEVAGRIIDEYLLEINERLFSKESFKIGGFGCGPHANISFLRLLVNKLLNINKDLQIEIYFVDLSCNMEQLRLCKEEYKDNNNVFLFSSFNSFYEMCFAPNSMDFLFGFSVFSYPPHGWSPKTNYTSIFYINGYSRNEEIEKYSRDLWHEVIIKINSQLRKGGLLLVGEYGVSNSLTREGYLAEEYFEMIGGHLQKVVEKYNLKKFGCPLLQRNVEVLSEPILNNSVAMKVFITSDIIDNESHIRLVHKLANTFEERSQFMKINNEACTKPFIDDEDNKEVVEKAFEEFLESYLPESVDEKYIADFPGILFSAVKI